MKPKIFVNDKTSEIRVNFLFYLQLDKGKHGQRCFHPFALIKI